jgi:hypothetical protein
MPIFRNLYDTNMEHPPSIWILFETCSSYSKLYETVWNTLRPPKNEAPSIHWNTLRPLKSEAPSIHFKLMCNMFVEVKHYLKAMLFLIVCETIIT